MSRPAVRLWPTALAARQIADLRGNAAKAVDAFLRLELAKHGCATPHLYALSGSPHLERICVRHVGGRWRVVVTFESPTDAVILLVGQHVTGTPEDVYAALYELVGHEPALSAGRDKPPCCEDDESADFLPTTDIDELVDRARSLA